MRKRDGAAVAARGNIDADAAAGVIKDRHRVGNCIRFCLWVEVECASLPVQVKAATIDSMMADVMMGLSLDEDALRRAPQGILPVCVTLKDPCLNPRAVFDLCGVRKK